MGCSIWKLHYLYTGVIHVVSAHLSLTWNSHKSCGLIATMLCTHRREGRSDFGGCWQWWPQSLLRSPDMQFMLFQQPSPRETTWNPCQSWYWAQSPEPVWKIPQSLLQVQAWLLFIWKLWMKKLSHLPAVSPEHSMQEGGGGQALVHGNSSVSLAGLVRALYPESF